MKGLLLKDWYMTRKYCKAYLLIAIMFLAISVVNDDNMFFVFYPCLLCGMIPVNLLGYDERSRWTHYSAVLPYTRDQLVSVKYLIGLLLQGAVLLATGIAQCVKMAMNDSFGFQDLAVALSCTFIIASFSSSICLPFIFKLGVEKGRIAYYVMVGFVCAGSVIASALFQENLQAEIEPTVGMILLALAGIGSYALSWYVSIVFYRKREL